MASNGSSSQTNNMNETPRSLRCRECGQGCASARELVMHLQSSHMVGHDIIPAPRSLGNNIPHSNRSYQFSSLEPRNMSQTSPQPTQNGCLVQLSRPNYNRPSPNSVPSSYFMLSAQPPRQPIMPKNIMGSRYDSNSNVRPWQQLTTPVLVPEAERRLNVQESSTSTKWYLDQLDVPIKKVIDEDDEVMAKLGLSKVDVSLKL